MSLIYAYQNRGLTKDLAIRNAADAVITPSSDDVIRVVIGHEGRLGSALAGAKLVVASDAPTAEGSTFTKNGGSAAGYNRLRLDASDLAFGPGTYTLFLDYFDGADADEWKNVDRQVFVLEET